MNLLLELPDRVLEHGPATVPVSLDEYQQLVREARSIFVRQSYRRNDALVFLAFLKGYTEYHEVSEHENKFWESFADELKLRDFSTTNSMYDWLWWVFEQHPYCAKLRVRDNGRRMAVKTIRTVWGYQIMKATDFNRAFEAYYLNPRKTTLDQHFFMQLFPKADPNLWHQVDTYQKIFEGLARVLDLLLDQGWKVNLRDQASILDALQRHGHTFEEPHPVKYMFCKSSTTLANLVERVRYGGKRRFSVGVTRRRSEAIDLECVLEPQVFSTQEQVVVEVTDHQRELRGTVVLHGPAGHRVQVVQGKANLGFLKEGLHTYEVFINGAPTGRTLDCRVIEGLQVLFHKDSPVLVEGHWYTGEVRRQDGRFELFRYRPQWMRENHTWKVQPQHCVLALDWPELSTLQLKFEPQSVAVRVMDSRTSELVEEIQDLRDLPYLQVHGTSQQLVGKHTLKAFVGSKPRVKVPVSAQGGTLQPLLRELQRSQDEIIIAAVLDGRQEDHHTRLFRLKVRLSPEVHPPELRGSTLHVHGKRLIGCQLQVKAVSSAGVTKHQEVFREDTLLLPLDLGGGFEDLRWEVKVLSPQGGVICSHTLQVTAQERLQKLLNTHLASGIGWGRFRPAGK